MAGVSELVLFPPLEPEEEEQEDPPETLDFMQPSFLRYVDNSHPFNAFSPRYLHSQSFDPSLHSPIIIDSSEDEERGEAIAADFEIHEIEDSDSNYEHFCSGCGERSILFDPLTHGSQQIPFNPISGSGFRVFEEIVDMDSNCSDCNGRLSLSLDLFNRCYHRAHVDPIDRSEFRVFEENSQRGLDGLELGLGFGVGDANEVTGRNGFFVRNSTFEVGESSQARALEGDSLRLSIGFASGPDSNNRRIELINLNSDGEDASGRAPYDLNVSPCPSPLRFFDPQDFEWEDVDRRAEESEAINMEIETAINMEFDATVNVEDFVQEIDDVPVVEEDLESLEWEFVVAVNDQEERDMESYLIEHGDYIYPTDYELHIEHFEEAENSIMSYRPAVISFIENLPSIFLTKEDIENNNAICTICTDDISLEEQVKRLPCGHHYHVDCILPWLRIQNTCPVCRFELPTDLDNEHGGSPQAANGAEAGRSYVRYDLEILPEAQ